MSSEARKSFKEKLSSTFGLKKEEEAMQGKSYQTTGGPDVDVTSSSRKTQHTAPSVTLSNTAHGHMNPLDWEAMPSVLRDRLGASAGNTGIGRATRLGNGDNEDEGGGKSTPLITDTAQNSQNGVTTVKKKSKPHPIRPKGTKEYTVSDRDSLRSIAAIFDTTPSELKKLNKLMSDMVFPGKKLYVPDKDYTPSPPRSPDPTGGGGGGSPLGGAGSPKSPKSPPDIPVVRQAERQKKPGRVERLNSREDDRRDRHPSGGIGPPGGARKLSEEQAKKLDQECYERFIKVNVKHITDGQGVVSGTLLVTPNAIMFDPNVSDTLVIEHGADMYGMIAPMETVISAAMYHDIAAMKLKGQKKLEQEEHPEVYHTSDCPLSASQQPTDNTGHHGNQDANGNVSRSNSDVIASCSCDVETKLKLSKAKDASSDVTNQNVVAMETSAARSKAEKDSANMADKHDRLSKEGEESSEGRFTVGSVEEGEGGSPGASSQCDAQSTSNTASADHVSADVTGHVTSRDQSQDGTTTTTAAVASMEQSTTENTKPAENKSDNITEGASTVLPPAATSAEPHTEHFQQDTESGKQQQQQQHAKSSAISIPDVEGRLQRTTPLESDGRTPPTPPNTPGILDRTLGSLSSIGSPISSNLTKVVNFSSGLFVRNPEQTSASIVDFADMYPESPESVSQNVPKDAQDGQSSSVPAAGGAGGKAGESGAPPAAAAAHREVTVESVVRLDDKPELFKNLAGCTCASDLVPKPAAQFEDPPLYLCLRIGVPINKTVSKTCPIESYKKRSKPEYWFSIPRDKVDPLYAFFIQWSPDIYGGEDEISASDRGFIVITEEDTDDSAFDKLNTPVEDHFRAASAGAMSKNWEIVNMEEARRRMSLLGEAELPLPDLSNPSTILNEEQIKRLCNHLPPRAEGYPWTMVYSTDKHGFSLKTLYRSMVGFDSPMLLSIKDTHNQIFGALINCPLRMSDHFYGTGESFLYTFHNEFKKFKWTGLNSFFVKGNQESLWIGAGGEGNGLWLDGDIYHGRTQCCDTFSNELLTSTEDFMVKGMEAWAFV